MPKPSVSKTLMCVAIAGVFFIAAALLNHKYLFVIAAFFDWLPVVTKWMRFGVSKVLARVHAGLTLIAYVFGIAWFFTSWIGHALLFLELWFLAVLLGFAASIPRKVVELR